MVLNQSTDTPKHEQDLANIKDAVETLSTEHSKRIEKLDAKVELLTQARGTSP